MTRTVLSLLAVLIPLHCLGAFQEQIVDLGGVKVTATRTTAGSCGVDFVIAVSDGDQHLVKIDYSYAGVFSDFQSSMSYNSSTRSRTYSDVVNVSVGRLTYAGNFTRVMAKAGGLVCQNPWDFSFTVSEYNASQDQRDQQEARRRRAEEEQQELARKREEEEQNQRRRNQDFINFQNMQRQVELDNLERFRRENPGCVVGSSADIQQCRKWQEQERLQNLQLQATNQRRAQIESEKARIEHISATSLEQFALAMQSSPNCSVMIQQLPSINAPTGSTAEDISYVQKINEELRGNFTNRQASIMNDCGARLARTSQQTIQPVPSAIPAYRPPAANPEYDSAIRDIQDQTNTWQKEAQRRGDDNDALLDLINSLE